jgi:hypothetical protein
MNEEFYALERNKTWHLVFRESASNIVYSKWVNELKKHDISMMMVQLINTKLVLFHKVLSKYT